MSPPSPPPLKSRSGKGPPPRPSSKDRTPPPLKGSRDALREALAALEASGEGEPVREDGSEGEWLFKQDDVVKGPVPASVIVDAIESGELGDDTPVAREMGKWFPLTDVPYFNRVFTVTHERKEAEAELVRARAAQRRITLVRVALMLLIALVPSAAGAAAGYGVMKARPWDTTLDYVDRHPPLVDLPPKPKPKPVVAKAEVPEQAPPAEGPAEGTDEGDEAKGDEGEEGTKVASAKDDKDDDKGRSRRRRSRRGKDSKSRDSGKDKASAKDRAADKNKASAKARGKDDQKVASAKQLRTLNQNQIMAGLKKGYGGFKKCIGTEMKRNPDMPGRITMAFSVSNNGKAINFKLLERQVRKGPLAGCMGRVVAKLSWPTFYGERKYVEFPLNISKNR